MTVNRRIHTAKVILEELIEKPQRWTELEKATVKASPTFSSFRSTLNECIEMAMFKALDVEFARLRT